MLNICFKRAIIALTCFIIFANTAYSQWVPIHSSFASYISLQISAAAVSGNMLDTTNTAVTTLQNLTIFSSSVTDITGIQYFDNLKNLRTSTSLVSVPILPPLLQSLDVNPAGSSIAAPLPGTLTSLKIRGGSLSSIPTLPSGLTLLSVVSCPSIVSLPALPAGLQNLIVNYAPTNFVFPILPNGLKVLDYSNTAYGPTAILPANLITFNANVCPNLTSITNIPSTLKTLSATNSGISTLGTFPISMDRINLGWNPITSIMQLPDTITDALYLNNLASLTNVSALDDIYIGTTISVENSPNANWGPWLEHIMNYDTSYYSAITLIANYSGISNIPQLRARYQYIYLSNNPLNYLSSQDTFCRDGNCWHPLEETYDVDVSYCNLYDLNSSFFHYNYNYYGIGCRIDASFNNLTYLSWIPKGGSFNVANNQITDFNYTVINSYTNLKNNLITCLPYIEGGVQSLLVSGNPLNCLPNIPNTNFTCDITPTVCTAGNSNNCPVLSIAGGRVFNDLNNDGNQDTGEGWLANYLVRMDPVGVITQSDVNGRYKFDCPINENLTIQGLPSYPYRIVTTNPHGAYFTQLGDVDTLNQRIGIHTIPNVNDLIIKITPYVEARPGFNHKYRITVKNEGTTVQNGNIIFYYDTALVYQSASVPGTNTAGTITWPINNMQPLSQFTTDLQFLIPAVVPLGYHINAGAYALGNIPDTTLYDNHDTVMQIAIGSYDPNDKQVFPVQGLSQQEIAAGKYLDYLVRFQNTGTASAINIRVEDTLSAALNINTFEMLDASHAYTWKIENNLLTVSFANIQLPDSGADEVNSHGFFRFRIRPYPNATVGDQINNTAYIYFDFNEAVITNTAHTIVSDLFVKQPEPQVLCAGERLLLTVQTGNGIIAKQWYRNDTALNNITDTVYVNSITTAHLGQYYCEVTLANGEKYKSNIVGVQVYTIPASPPVFNITGQLVSFDSLRICYSNNTGNATYYFVPTSQEAAAYNFKWYVNDSLIGTTNPAATNIGIKRVWQTGDKLTAYIQSPCGQIVSADSAYMVIDHTADTLQLTITPSIAQICPGEEVKFKATSVNGDGSYQWRKNNTNLGSGDSIIVTGLTATDRVTCFTNTTYAQGCATIYTANGNDLRRDTATVVVNPAALPQPGSATLVLTTAPFCPGSSNTISVNGYNLGTAPQYQWTINGAEQNGNSSTFTTSTINNNDVVQCRIARTLCGTDTFLSAPLTLSETINLPSITIALTSPGSCSNLAFFNSVKQNLTATNINYNWFANGVMQGSTPGFSLSRSTEHADTIYLRANTHKPCGDSIVISNIIILPPVSKNSLDLTIAGPTITTICKNQTVSFTTNGPAHRWYVNGVLKGTSASTTFSYSDTADFAVQGVLSPTSCYNADTSNIILIHVLSSPVVPSLQIVTSPASFCAGQEVKLTAVTSISQQYNINWLINNSNASGVSITRSNLQDGDLIKCSVYMSGTCINPDGLVEDSFVVHMPNQVPTADVSTAVPLTCQASSGNTFSISGGYYLGSFPTYEWFKNGTAVGNSTTYTDNALQAGDYIYCQVTSNNPCVNTNIAITDTLSISNGNPVVPTIVISESANNVCEGTSIAISSQVSNQGNTPTYQWTVNGDTIPYAGSNLPPSQFQDGDVVVCTLTSSDVCASPPKVISNEVKLWVTESVTPTVSVSANDSTICAGTAVNFNLSSLYGGSAPNYTWKINGNVVSTSSNFSSSTLQNGDVLTVEMTTDEPCATANTVASSPISFTVYNMPAKPFITQNANVLTSSYAVGNAWYYNGTPIAGANTYSYTATETGWYSVLATNNNGCGAISDSVYVVVLGINSTANNPAINIYPNPASTSVNILVSQETVGAIINMIDATGKIVMERTIEEPLQIISTQHLAKGVYTVEVRHINGSINQTKLVLQ